MKAPKGWLFVQALWFFIGLVFFGLPTVATAAYVGPQETGLPLMRNFTPKDYAAAPQNWAIVQDRRGVVYVGNNNGVLEFDGQRWRLIPVANNTTVNSLAVDANGRVYVGAVGEIGYLQPDAEGQMRYVSLLDRMSVADRQFAEVWSTFDTPQGVVFSSAQQLMQLQGERVQSWKPHSGLGVALGANDRAFVVEVGRGLLELIGGEWRLVAGGERFANDAVLAILSVPPQWLAGPGTLLVASRARGLELFAGGQFTPWSSEIGEALNRDKLMSNSAAFLPDGQLVFGTVLGGLYVLDRHGKLVRQLTKGSGLQSPIVGALLPDREGGLWLGLGNGLARVELTAPLSRFDGRAGLVGEGSVLALHRHQGALFVGTTQGAYRLLPGPRAGFQKINGISGQTWAFLSVGNAVLAANTYGVYSITDRRATRVLDVQNATSLLQSPQRPDRVLVGLGSGLAVLSKKGNTWRDEGRVQGISDYVRTLYEDGGGQLWMGTYNTGVLRLPMAALDHNQSSPPAIERFTESAGLPSLNYNLVFPIGGQARFATSAGIYRFNDAQRRFEPDPRYSALFKPPRVVYVAHDDPLNRLWLYSEDPASNTKDTGLVTQLAADRYAWDSKMLRALNGRETMSIYSDKDGVVWFGSDDGLFRYDPGIAKSYEHAYSALLRRVSGSDGKTLYGGSGEPTAAVLQYVQNALRFEYGAPSFDGQGAVRFQVKLEGTDTDWSAWSDENYKDYNNLFEGQYRFRVRAINMYDTVSTEATYSFRVLAPWYRTHWAYLGYLLALLVCGWASLRWRLQRLQGQKVALERTVAERTQQIATLGEIGRTITAQLDLDAVLDTLYAPVHEMLDAHAFAIGLYRPEQGEIAIRLAVEGGQRQPPYVISVHDQSQLAARCVQLGEPILTGAAPVSVLYVPLQLKGQVIGVIGVQSLKSQAYGTSDLHILQTLAAYAGTAIDNAQSHQALGLQTTELLTANEKLVALDGFKRGLMAMIVHDLKNPLNIILTTLESRAVQSRLALLQQSARQMLTMVLNILDVQKFEDTKMVLDRQDGAIATIAERAVEQVRFLIERKNITLEIQMPTNLGVRCDAEMIGRVFVNLLTNAVKYSPNNGRMVVSASAQSGAWVRVQVQDHGEGIPADRLEDVFQKFGQHKARGSGDVRSTGLGLNFCKLAVEGHGGEIGVTSAPDVGSTFWFTLPGRADAAAVTVAVADQSSSSVIVHSRQAETAVSNLSEADRLLLAPVAATLGAVAIYRYSELLDLLRSADFPSNARTDVWRTQIEAAIETENDALFKALLAL